MVLEAQMCPKCGAAIKFAVAQTEVVCAYCGATVVQSSTGAVSLGKEIEQEQLVDEVFKREDRLQSKGQPATAKILSVQNTGIIRIIEDSKCALLSFAVEIKPDRGASYKANAKVFVELTSLKEYQPGTLLDVRYDPKDPMQVIVSGQHEDIEQEKLVDEVLTREDRLQSKGRPATARILTVQNTGIIRSDEENGSAVVLMSFGVEVQPDRGASYKANAKVFIDQTSVYDLHPGIMLDVRYDPKDPSQVAVFGQHEAA